MEALDKGGRLLQQQYQQEEHLRHRLHGHRGSYQAWKCVSFGCSLLALLLLLSKCYEVSTDLNLLLGIDRLLRQQASGSHNATSLSWPPVPIEQLLPDGPQESNSSFGMDSLESNQTMLMSHLQMSLGRQLRADQLLRQEVDAFVVEFQNAKSTLSLSALLVSIYIVSWLLMTLAVNETRVASNDTSLRNIILLSVFGAVDIAASVGFVMVRLIMYSVKNVPFAREMLDSTGLRESGIRLSADQLTAFTALRLIAMRSCSAYVDVYVSCLVALLTLLRLYAVLRALAYFRRLRRNRDHRHHKQHHNLKRQHQQVWSSFLGGGSASGPFGSAQHLVSAGADPADFRSAPNAEPAMGRAPLYLHSPMYRHSHSHHRRYPLPAHLVSGGEQQPQQPPHHQSPLADYEPSATLSRRTKTAPRHKLRQSHHLNSTLRNHQSSLATSKPPATSATSAQTLTLPRQPRTTNNHNHHHQLPLLLLSRHQPKPETRRNSSAPNLLVVKGRLVRAEQHSSPRAVQLQSDSELATRRQEEPKVSEQQAATKNQEQLFQAPEVTTEEPKQLEQAYKLVKEKPGYRLLRAADHQTTYTSAGSPAFSLSSSSSSSSGVVPCEDSDDSAGLVSPRPRARFRARSRSCSRSRAAGDRLSEELVAPKVFQVLEGDVDQNHNSISLAKYYYA